MPTRIARRAALALMALAAATFSPANLHAQTILSNETLVATNYVVSKTTTTAQCNTAGCTASHPMLTAIPVTCPASIGGTCTFHIMLDAKVETSYPCHVGSGLCSGGGPQTRLRFLVDGGVPTPGPTDSQGAYLLGGNGWATAEGYGETNFVRASYTASVVATVTNTTSTNHTIDVDLKCSDQNQIGGCLARALSNTVRVNVFEP